MFGNLFNSKLLSLQGFANQTVDLRSPQQLQNLNIVKKELPPFWMDLESILKFEPSSRFLPADVANIVKKMLQIRVDIFENSVQRRNTDYIR